MHFEDGYAVAHDVSWEAANYEASSRPLKHSMLRKVCDAVNEVIAGGGGALKQRCFEHASGHLPETEKLTVRYPAPVHTEVSEGARDRQDHTRPVDCNISAHYPSDSHPADAQLRLQAIEEYARVTTTQGIAAIDAAPAFQERFSEEYKEYKERGICKQFHASTVVGALHIETRKFTSQKLGESMAQMNPEDRQERLADVMEHGILFL